MVGIMVLVRWSVVIVVVHFPVAIIRITPLELGFEGMIFLRQIFLSEVVFVAPLVSPFVNLVLWYVYILKIMVRSISTRFGGWHRYLGECSRQTKHKRQAKDAKNFRVHCV